MDLVFFSDLDELPLVAYRLKEKEIVVAKRFSGEKEILELKQKAKRKKLEIKTCQLVAEEKEIKEFKGKADFLSVLGGSIALNKFAANSKQIDFLLQPANMQRVEFDSAIANTAAQNNVSVAVLQSTFLNATQYDRVSLFRNYFLIAKICKKATVKFLAFSGAQKKEEMRSSADLEAFSAFLQQKSLELLE